MSRVFINGEFFDSSEAKISVFDNGFGFGDSLYEVIMLKNGKTIDMKDHILRLVNSFNIVKYITSYGYDYFFNTINSVLNENKEIKNGMIYLQITRGTNTTRYKKIKAFDDHSIVSYIIPCEIDSKIKQIKCGLIPDHRRYMRNIKMTSLMPMLISKGEIEENGYDYGIYYDMHTKAITEGLSSNVFIVTHDDKILTHPNSHEILPGCTRSSIINILNKSGMDVIESRFYEKDLLDAKEVFVTASIKMVQSVSCINNSEINQSKIGYITQLCFEEYLKYIS
jgi:D-alanine transaminase